MKYLTEAWCSTTQAKKIPSLDGLRALSVLMVIVGHIYLNAYKGPSTKLFIFHDMGVSLFFIISGYLITRLLIKELISTGGINFYNFFLKRIFRIFPAYYFFLLITYLLLPQLGVFPDSASLISCLLYLGYYYPPVLLDHWAHTWSLAIEEQFYLLWPLLLKTIKNKKNIRTALIVIILISPLSRVLTYYYLPSYKHDYPFLLHTRLDSLAFGALFSIIEKSPLGNSLKYFTSRKITFSLSLIYLFIFYPILNYHYLGKFRATIGYSLESIFLLFMMIYLINTKKTSIPFRLLNSKLLTHFGALSYGIYLWQQPFTYLKNDLFFLKTPFNIFAIYFMALTSYILIEFPFMKLRKRIL